jgi:hypothetical protein
MILPSISHLPCSTTSRNLRHSASDPGLFLSGMERTWLAELREISAVYHTGRGPVDETASFFHRVSAICYNYRSNSGIGTELCRWRYYSLSQIMYSHY